ncbi:MotA/TolQ/ExbB proton channel family protein [Myxococcota bacterium]|nr:MotA/TolQ/ExbB proton channel family protein [Myxococcota bacterium]MBU1379778.1 MotA/TolQ/ExbB proton channel family protein [Myxococcota bacterium]MBU1498510.1 MotA/TolQ/ExbB proton channel family protein [Myxococcota bacterium]
MKLFEFLARGGILMIPIGLASMAGLALVLERLFAIRRSIIIPEDLKKRLRKSVQDGDLENARRITENHSSPLGRLASKLFENDEIQERSELKEILEERGRKEVHHLNRNVEIIGVIAAVTPLMGLLGTVTGMISVFRNVMNQVSSRGVNPALLASGIWEALITTAAGLSVAIPLYLAYRYLSSRSETLVIDLEEEVQHLTDAMLKQGSVK